MMAQQFVIIKAKENFTCQDGRRENNSFFNNINTTLLAVTFIRSTSS